MKACVMGTRVFVLILLVLGSSSLWAAQTQTTFDVVSLTPPAGWSAAQDGDHLAFTFIDNPAKTYVMLAVYNSTPGSGDGQKDFLSEWKNVVGQSFSVGAAPQSTAGRSRAGLHYREGAAEVKQHSGEPIYVKLLTFWAGSRRFSVMLVATNQGALEKQQQVTQSFLDSLQLAPQAARSANAPAVATDGAPGAAPRPGKSIAGVWMGFKQLYGYEPSPRWYTFYDDGQVFEDIPRTGFGGFNRQSSQTDPHQHDYWGTYSFAGGAGSISKPGVRYPEKLLSEGQGKLKIDSDHFYLCRPVDGLRLQGAWTSLANPNDPDLDRWRIGERPVFRFTGDGKFSDEGVFATFLKTGNPREDAAGTGTYEVRDYTLILRFSDGRVKQLAITGMLGADPAASNDMLFIARSVFRKRR